MKTKPFNLEEALNGAKVVTRDGREVTQLTKFNVREGIRIVGVIEGYRSTLEWDNIEGFTYSGCESTTDLFLVKEPKSVWVNVYVSDKGNLLLSSPNDTKQDALQTITKGEYYTYLKTIEITDEP
jgi:hypothetical protein